MEMSNDAIKETMDSNPCLSPSLGVRHQHQERQSGRESDAIVGRHQHHIR